MSYFDKKRGAVKVDLSDGYWVRLRHLTTQESRTLGEIQDKNEAGMAGFVMAILEWNFDDENGNTVPVTSDSVGQMPQNDFSTLAEAFAKMEGVKTDATFPSTVADRNRDELARAAGLAAVPATPGPVGETGAPAGDAGALATS